MTYPLLRTGLLLLLFTGCLSEKPTVIIPPTPIGDGGRLIRELYQASWSSPGGDDQLIQIGIIPSKIEIQFKALAPMRIRAYSESDSWEVASPKGVVWKASVRRTVRPPIVTHFATVGRELLPSGKEPPSKELLLWINRGYSSARWVRSLALEPKPKAKPFVRWFLSLTPPTAKKNAEDACLRARKKFHLSCQVVSRVELPPLSEGILEAQNSTFSKTFRGFLELLSPSAPVEIRDFVAETRTGDRSNEQYGPRLFLIPNVDGELTLVQATTLGNYLTGVVTAEIFPGGPSAALQAQAVVARTYALRYFKPAYTIRPYLICGSTDCQVHRGATKQKPGPAAAVRATSGFVLRERGGKLASTYYHAICGGHTEPRRDIWGGPNLGYLVGSSDQINDAPFVPLRTDAAVSDYLQKPSTAYCGSSSFSNPERWRWSVEIDQPTLDSIASKVGLRPPLTNVAVTKRGVSGRALQIELSTRTASKTMRGELRIRQLFGGLLSSLFVFEPKRIDAHLSALLIRGGGYGHGVGLCQVGAVGRAEKGQSVAEILRAYYPGTRLAPLQKGVVR